MKTTDGGDDAPSDNISRTKGPLSSSVSPSVKIDRADASVSPKSFLSISGPSMDLTHRFNNVYSAVDGVPSAPSLSTSSKHDGSDAVSQALSSMLTVGPTKSNGGLSTSTSSSERGQGLGVPRGIVQGQGLGKSLGQGSAVVNRPMSAIEKAFCFGDDDEDEAFKLTLPSTRVNAKTTTTTTTPTTMTPDAPPSKLGSFLSIGTKKDSFVSIGDHYRSYPLIASYMYPL